MDAPCATPVRVENSTRNSTVVGLLPSHVLSPFCLSYYFYIAPSDSPCTTLKEATLNQSLAKTDCAPPQRCSRQFSDCLLGSWLSLNSFCHFSFLYTGGLDSSAKLSVNPQLNISNIIKR